MFAAGWLEEALAGFVDFDRSSRGTLGLDRTRKHEDEDASSVVMLDRLSAWGVGDDDRCEALAWHVGQRLREKGFT
jgi:hypothetical protein